MKNVALVCLAASMGALFAACTLNPQPLPPDDDDDKSGAPTSAVPGSGSSNGGFEGAPSDSADAGAVRESGTDASEDASTDAADAADQ